MDGLEIKEKNLQEVQSATDYFRIEAEYFNAKTFSYKKSLKGSQIISEIQYGTSKYCDENNNGYPVLRLNELNNGFIEKPQKYCDILTKEEIEKLKLNKNDVLVIRTNGNPNLVGKAAIVMEDTEYAFASYLYRVLLNEKIHPETLVAYLNCKYGRYEIDKNSIKGNQTNFSPAKFKDIIIPVFNDRFQDTIKELFSKSYNYRTTSDIIFSSAEELLQSTISFDSVKLVKDSISIQSISKSFSINGRLDAEYYQPKYKYYENALCTSDSVKTLCNLYDKNITPNYTSKYKYIELANVGIFGEINNVEILCGKHLPSRARRKVKKGQIIVSSVEGSLQSCALITDEFDGSLCSTGFYVLDSDYINSETLLVLFKSEPIQALLKQRCSGTILTAISKEELLSMPLPQIEQSIQDEIAEKIQQSFALRRKSEELLEFAKQAVEKAIEKDEDEAIAWLESKVNA